MCLCLQSSSLFLIYIYIFDEWVGFSLLETILHPNAKPSAQGRKEGSMYIGQGQDDYTTAMQIHQMKQQCHRHRLYSLIEFFNHSILTNRNCSYEGLHTTEVSLPYCYNMVNNNTSYSIDAYLRCTKLIFSAGIAIFGTDAGGGAARGDGAAIPNPEPLDRALCCDDLEDCCD